MHLSSLSLAELVCAYLPWLTLPDPIRGTATLNILVGTILPYPTPTLVGILPQPTPLDGGLPYLFLSREPLPSAAWGTLSKPCRTIPPGGLGTSYLPVSLNPACELVYSIPSFF